jgi:hypothetical protein
MADRAEQFSPGEIWPDDRGVHINAHGGGILFHRGAFYWFGEHKIAGEAGNQAHVGVHCYTSTDLYNWKDAGIALPVASDPQSDITAGCVIERPKVIFNRKTNRFVMWFHLELKGQHYKASRAGVAVADKPAGPYTFLRSFRPNAGRWPVHVTPAQREALRDEALMARMKALDLRGDENPDTPAYPILTRDFAGGQMARDMTLFVDDDGKAYHVYASEENSTLHISLLSDDYLAPAGKYVRVFENRWHEAPALCKHAGRYWLIASGCTCWDPNAARSAVADSIWGPWTELGNPATGINPENGMGPEKTFGGQSTFILPVPGIEGACIAMFDLWRPANAIDGRYLWLPMVFGKDRFTIPWTSPWNVGFFSP